MWSRNRMAIHYFFFVSFNSICFFSHFAAGLIRFSIRAADCGAFRPAAFVVARRSSFVLFSSSAIVFRFFSVLFYSRIPKLTEPLKKTQAAAAEAFSFIRSFIHFIRRRRWGKKKISVHSKRNCFHNSFILSNRFNPNE